MSKDLIFLMVYMSPLAIGFVVASIAMYKSHIEERNYWREKTLEHRRENN